MIFFVSMRQSFCRTYARGSEHHHAWVHRRNVREKRGDESSKVFYQQRLVSERRKLSWVNTVAYISQRIKPEWLPILSELCPCAHTATTDTGESWSTFCSTWTAAGMSGCQSESRRIALRSIVLTNMRGHAARLISISENGNGGTIHYESSKL